MFLGEGLWICCEPDSVIKQVFIFIIGSFKRDVVKEQIEQEAEEDGTAYVENFHARRRYSIVDQKHDHEYGREEKGSFPIQAALCTIGFLFRDVGMLYTFKYITEIGVCHHKYRSKQDGNFIKRLGIPPYVVHKCKWQKEKYSQKSRFCHKVNDL